MAECASLPKCIFFNDKMSDMPATAEIYKNRYCLDNFIGCARFKVSKALGREKVPSDLFPNQIERADEIIKQNEE